MRFPGCSRDAAPAEGLQAAGTGAWWEKAWIFHPAKAGRAGKRCQGCQLPARGHCERRAERSALLLPLPLSLLSPGSGAVPPHGLPALPIPARFQVPCLRANPGSTDQPQPRPAQRRRICGSVCMKWNFTRFTGSESRRSTSNPPRLPGAWRRQGWVGMGLHPPGSGSRNSGPLPNLAPPPEPGGDPGTKAGLGEPRMERWRRRKALPAAPGDGSGMLAGSCPRRPAPPAPCGGDKGTPAGPGGCGASPPAARSSGAADAQQAQKHPPFAGFGFFPEVSRRFTLTTKGRDLIHHRQSEVSGNGHKGEFYRRCICAGDG